MLQRELILASGLFDSDWYRTFYPEVADSGLDPATHYLRIGGKEGLHPSRFFDAGFYLSKYPEVAKSNLNPLIHYLRFGLAQGRQIRSLDRSHDCERIKSSGLFDQGWYLSIYPDVAAAGVDPYEHYLDFAVLELRDPGPLFSTLYYLTLNPDALASGSNPLLHYVENRLSQNLKVRGGEWQRQRTVLLRSSFFDPDWYLETYVDVASTGADPLDHYLEFGGPERRSPSPYFDAKYYLHEYPEVAAAGINPLLHYLQNGAAEGRRIHYLPIAVDLAGPASPTDPDLCVFEMRQRQLAVEDFKQADDLRPPPGNDCQLRRLGLRSDKLESNGTENGDLPHVKILQEQELTVAQKTNAALSKEVEQLKVQLTAARVKIRSVWDFIFRLQAEHAADSANFKAELATLNHRVPELFACLVDLKRQNNALRVQHADSQQTVDRLRGALAKSRGETIQAGRERDGVRLQLARFLNSKARLLKSLFRF